MTQLAPFSDSTASPFDAIRHIDSDGIEHWLGRELMGVMDYASWHKFAQVILKAKASLALVQGELAAEHHFPGWESDGKRWSSSKVSDFRLTRFGAYLTAMAGDDTKESIAQARIYFAIKTRQAEVAEQQPARRDLSRRELAQMVIEAEDRADAEAQRAEAAEAVAAEQADRLAIAAPKAAVLDAIEAGTGMTLKSYRKSYFPDIPEREFFTHLYRRGFLIDQRGTGAWDARRQRYYDGPQHGHPAALANPYLYLHSVLDRFDVRRFHARVRPGQPEVKLRDLLVRQGLTPKLITDADLEGDAS